MTACEAAIQSIGTEPGRWCATNYVLRRDDGIEIWIANGSPFYGVYRSQVGGEVGGKFSFWEQRRFGKALRAWRNDSRHIAAHPQAPDETEGT